MPGTKSYCCGEGGHRRWQSWRDAIGVSGGTSLLGLPPRLASPAVDFASYDSYAQIKHWLTEGVLPKFTNRQARVSLDAQTSVDLASCARQMLIEIPQLPHQQSIVKLPNETKSVAGCL